MAEGAASQDEEREARSGRPGKGGAAQRQGDGSECAPLPFTSVPPSSSSFMVKAKVLRSPKLTVSHKDAGIRLEDRIRKALDWLAKYRQQCIFLDQCSIDPLLTIAHFNPGCKI